MKRLVASVAVLFFINLILPAQSLSSLLGELDRVIEHKGVYIGQKEQRLSELKSASGLTGKALFDVYADLFVEYANYNVDSAFTYCSKMLSSSMHLDLLDEYESSLLHMADLYTATGMYYDAFKILQERSFGDKAMYYHCLHSLYTGMMQSAPLDADRNRYSFMRIQVRDSMLTSISEASMEYVYAMSEKLSDQGKYAAAIDLIKAHYDKPSTTERARAIMDYSLAVAWKGVGDNEMAKWYYARSSIADLKSPVRDYKSLLELALILYEEGDLERAFRYIMCSMEDLQASNTRIRTMEFSPVVSLITDSYQKKITSRTRQLSVTLILLSLIVFLLIVTSILLYAQKNKTNAAKKKLEMSYIALRELGDIKEEYLFMYMEQISDYIDQMEGYHRKLLRTWRKYGPDKLAEELERPTDMDQALKNFYSGFDETFLRLFPTFIDDVNALLKPDEHLVLKHGKKMSTELRLLALIRLGVTDSAKAGHFLRCSVATIYNYRTKLRKAAINPDGFDGAVSKIGLTTINL